MWKREKLSQEKYLKNNGWNYPRFTKRHKFTDSKHSTNPKQMSSKKITPQHIINKLRENKNTEKIKQLERNYKVLTGKQQF